MRAKGSSPGYILVALKEGAGEHGPMIVDDQGQLVWYSKYRSARDFRVQGPVSGVTDTVSGTVGGATDTVRGATDNLLGGGEKQR